MTSELELRRLGSDDVDAAFASRLRALEFAPNAFLTTLAEEKERGPSRYAEVLATPGDDNVVFGMLDGEVVVGTVGIVRHDRPKTQHKAFVWGMYVDESHRRRGIGAGLLDRAIEHAQRRLRVELLHLSLEADNEPARVLYESRGFVVWGREPAAMRVGAAYFDELHMVLDLR